MLETTASPGGGTLLTGIVIMMRWTFILGPLLIAGCLDWDPPSAGTDGDADSDSDSDNDVDNDADVQSDAAAEGTEPACDPDGIAPCTSDWFICTEGDAGSQECHGQEPAVPDGGEWDCVERGTTLVCQGDHVPATSFWVCEELESGNVICRRHAYVPADGTNSSWDCDYDGETRVCVSTGGSGGDADADADADIVADCLCIPGAWRYCDTPAYCRWGIQYCRDDGMEWGSCDEDNIPAPCAHIDGWYSNRAEECCVAQGFCCQDMWDIDHDGDLWESLGNCVDVVCI